MLGCVVILSREVSDFLVIVGKFSMFCSGHPSLAKPDHRSPCVHAFCVPCFRTPAHRIEVVTVSSSLVPRPTLFSLVCIDNNARGNGRAAKVENRERHWLDEGELSASVKTMD